MIAQIKNLAKHSSVYTLSTFVQRALGFVLLPVYTDIAYIPKTEYGDLALVYTLIAFMTIFYLYGIDLAFMRYFFLGNFRREDVYRTAFSSVLVSSIILSAALILLAPQAAYLLLGPGDYSLFIKLAAGVLFLDSLANLPYLLLRAEEKSATYSLIRIGRFIVELSLNILFVIILRQGIIGILYANLISSAVNILVLLPFQLKYLKGSFSLSVLKPLLRFGLPMLPNGLAYLTVELSDKYLMRLLLDKETLAVYAANYKFGSMFLLVVIAFRTAWQPFFLKVAKEEENPKLIYIKVMTYFTLIGAFLVTAGSYFVGDIVRLPLSATKTIMGGAYWGGIKIIPIILSAYLFYGIYVNLTVGVYIKKKAELMVIFTGLAALVNVGSNFYLMPKYGIMGAAVATLLSYFIMAGSIWIANRRIYPVQYEYGRIGASLIYVIVMLFILYFFEPAFLWRVVLIVLSPLVFIAGGFFRKGEIDFLKKKSGSRMTIL